MGNVLLGSCKWPEESWWDTRFVDDAFPASAASLGIPKAGRLFLTEEMARAKESVQVCITIHMREASNIATFRGATEPLRPR